MIFEQFSLVDAYRLGRGQQRENRGVGFSQASSGIRDRQEHPAQAHDYGGA